MSIAPSLAGAAATRLSASSSFADECVLANTFNPATQWVAMNIYNVFTGPGMWIVIAVGVIGFFMLILGNGVWFKRFGLGFLLLIAAGFLITIVQAVTPSNC